MKDVGFPIFIAVYLLFQVTPAIQQFQRNQEVLITKLDVLISLHQIPTLPIPVPYPRRP